MEVGSYKKKGDKPRRNKEGRQLFEPISRQVLYREGHWIPHRKRVYLIWFRLLQQCELDPNKKVNWKKYNGWGGSNYILGVKFDEFWKDNWKKLFGTKVRGKNPKYVTSTKISNYDSLRYISLVQEYGYKYPDLSSYEISQKIQERESRKRYPVPSFTEGLGFDGGVIDKRVIQQRVSVYRRKGNKMMDNICNGTFP